MKNNEFRGLNEGVILYVLKSGDRHTDEIKALIDETFFEIKVGTLYSIITRLKNQKFISEYRSSSDGSRRKYFALTADGVTYFNNTYGEKFVNAPKLEVKVERVVVEPTVKREKPAPAPKKEEIYENYVKSVENDVEKSEEPIINDIDFSQITDFENFNIYELQTKERTYTAEPTVAVKQPVEEKPKTVSVNPEIPVYTAPEVEPVKPEIDFDSVNNVNFEYKSVLNTLFPKNTASAQQFTAYQSYEDAVAQESTQVKDVSTDAKEDFDDIYSYAEKDGIKIRTSSDTNRYEGSKILHNLLRFHSSFVWYVTVIVEFLLLSLCFSSVVPFDSTLFAKICLFTAIVPFISTIIYFTNTSHTVKDLPRFKEVIEISLIIAISAIIITIALSSILEINFKDINEVYTNLITPALIALNVPIFYVIKYFLSNLEFYQTI